MKFLLVYVVMVGPFDPTVNTEQYHTREACERRKGWVASDHPLSITKARCIPVNLENKGVSHD